MTFVKRFLVVFGLVLMWLLLTGVSDRPNVGGGQLDEFIIWYAMLYTFAGLATFVGSIRDARKHGLLHGLTLWLLVVAATTAAVQTIYVQRGFDTTGSDVFADFIALATPAILGSLLGALAGRTDYAVLPEALAEKIRKHDESVSEKERPPAGWRTPD